MTAPLVVVVGDVLLDIDTVGSVGRLCPDAPAPVVEVDDERRRAGGAGLAATLAAADGCEVVLVSPLADDPAAAELVSLLAPSVRLLALPASGTTPVKHRVLAGSRGLVRIDRGTGAVADGTIPAEVAEALRGADAVLVSDYGRGTTAVEELRRLLTDAARAVPVVWDPHPRGADPVPAARLVTPNAAEAEAACSVGGTGLAAVGTRADALVRRWDASAVAITLGPRGALLSYGDGVPALVPARPVAGDDPCGAGDRFASRAAVQLAAGAVVSEAVESAVLAATDFVEAGGASAVGARAGAATASRPSSAPALADVDDVLSRVRAGGGTVVATGGCFDLLHAGHVATLEAARRLGDCLVVCLNSDESVRRLKGAPRPLVTAADRARVLTALECVDAVAVFDEDTPERVLRSIRPDVWVKGGDYAGARLPEQEVLSAWGGQAVAVPYLQGRSSTRLVRAAALHPTTRGDHP
ncbi:MAG TPA: D-glycero-beta-D-manno-heptose 1-phosphate adenylyltransferase [Jiangellales bacterium]|nr:D-glycero-beta-D-manno-heptose 1-phosphate adenylyltransferase [Jiangellales bacterium]